MKKKLEAVQKDIDGMTHCCQEMSSRLHTAKKETHELIVQTSQLKTEENTIRLCGEVLDAFMSRFQLSAEQQHCITSSEKITEEFFPALARAKTIHEDCKELLRTNQQQVGLAIMEQMATIEEAAYEKLYRWTQSKDNAEVES